MIYIVRYEDEKGKEVKSYYRDERGMPSEYIIENFGEVFKKFFPGCRLIEVRVI